MIVLDEKHVPILGRRSGDGLVADDGSFSRHGGLAGQFHDDSKPALLGDPAEF
jgi:hypothetical protein